MDGTDLHAGLDILCPSGTSLDSLSRAARAPFHAAAKALIGRFSRRLAQDPRARAFPEIIALAHWLRPRAIEDLEAGFRAGLPQGSCALGRGMALHFAPGNVDTIFLYSALLSVLAGNATVVRVSSRASPQIALLTDVLDTVLQDVTLAEMRDRLRILRYPRDARITAALSASCDLRVIWGGDASVLDIRSLPLPPRGRDVAFPDRWSLCVLDARAVLAEAADVAALARNFVNDAYWFGQMACSSPRLVLWHGTADDATAAAARFWPLVEAASDNFAGEMQAVQFVDKLVAQCSAAIDGTANRLRPAGSNMVSVAGLARLDLPGHDLLHIGGGFFWEAHLPNLDALAPLLDSRSQTLSSHGIAAQDWAAWVTRHAACIDRIVPVGQALQFDTIWDGMDLLREFTRLVTIRV
jgi:hypothetical protein